MKRLVSIAVLLFSMLGSGNVHALPVVDAGSIAQNTITATKSGLTALSTAVIEAKTTVMEAWNKSAWVQQLKGLWDSLQQLKKQVEEIIGLRDDLMNTLSGARDLGGWIPTTGSAGADTVDYNYASQLPQAYLPSISCSSSGTGCTVTGTGYTGIALSSVNSVSIRHALHVNNSGLSLTATDINKISNEAAERYAQEIAIIQAMAQEAYTQANNRIAKIEELREKITGATSTPNSKTVAGSGAQTAWSFNTSTAGNTHSVTSVATPATPNQYDGYGNLTVAGTLGLASSTSELSYPATSIDTTIGSDSTATSASAPPPTNRNDLKYIADLQAQIQVQQALLLNEQNKLTALAILQQSLHDAYEQRKKEIAAYVIEGTRDEFMVSLGRLGVAAAQKVSYSAVKGWYN